MNGYVSVFGLRSTGTLRWRDVDVPSGEIAWGSAELSGWEIWLGYLYAPDALAAG